ncbi:MAG: ABC transporter permease subunit [Tabrizicola sp.]|uniref:ABC transporter permease n=1 Tax=Tabrizicola sp. TaxID=2005166 RepID=UPI00273777A0|nr:ABC transporter permease subunit [Tabrizicola sp.]MDP3263228.1 ABC transporter permease subunit [Tabrizicola sp.]MDP3646585.1 ABC transporter permease subunit [Paracoccaceae bacterium]MDZ4069444.1 ABC transporter permease subunit [Tabrizicola sp.]
MSRVLPVLTVLAGIVVVWYLGAVWLNSTWVYDQAERAGTTVTLAEVIPQTMAQERPLLPPPHQVAAELWKGVAGQAVTSKRSLVYHGFVTFKGTMMGFALGIVLGVALAMSIVRFRVMDMSVMPWAIISQTIPIVALAPMILVVANQVGVQDRDVPKAIIAAYLSFFPVLVSMVKGLRSPDQMQLDLLRTYGANEVQTFVKLRLPASMPYFFASLKVAIAASLIGTIVGELPTGAIEGLGARMLIGSQFGEPLIMWAALFAAAILAGMLILAVGAVERFARARMGVPA